MMKKPKLDSYDINALVFLANQTTDEITRNKYKMILIEKFQFYKFPMFYLINKFICSKLILKEVYADLILINMKDNDYRIPIEIQDEILKYASLDAIMCYGADSKIYEFNIKCKEEFYQRGLILEDKIEEQRKKNLDKKLIMILNEKGDKK